MRTRVIALLTGLILLVTAAPAGAVSEVTRLAGADRYETAAAANCCDAQGQQRNFTTIVLASGAHFADALVGNYLAGLDNGILLLTDGDSITEGAAQVAADADDGTVTNLYVVGGEAAVSQNAIDELVSALGSGNAPQVTRVAGETSVDTSVAVARLRANDIGGFAEGTTYAIIATVGGFADSLAAAPLAYSANIPILFVRPGDVPPQVAQALDDLSITNALIVGGTAAVSNSVQSEVSAHGISVQRLAGPTRQETAVAVAEFAVGTSPAFDGRNFAIARGDAFPDSLAGGSHAGFIGAPVLLTQSSTELGFAAAGFLQRQSGTLERGWAYGGTGALADSVLEAAREASDGTSP